MESQPSVMTNGIEQQVAEEPAMDERQDTPSPVVQEVIPEVVSPTESPTPETEVRVLVFNFKPLRFFLHSRYFVIVTGKNVQ